MDKIEILNRLDKSKFYQELVPSLEVNGKSESLGLCPFHDDHNPSLSVNLESGLFHCFACDAKGDVFTFYQNLKGVDFPTALRELGLMAGVVDTSDIRPKVVATFKYTDEAGNILYFKERLEPGRNGRSKEFIFKHQVNGRSALGRGCNPVPYNLPQVVKSKYVFIVEGEGKADLLNSWGLIATCLDSGANSPVRDEYIQILGSMEKVVILPDNDKPGWEYASKIASVLHVKAEELKVIELPGLQEKEDIIDWAKIPSNNKEKLLELVKNTSVWTPKENGKYNIKISTINDMLRYEQPEYLIKPFLYKNTVNLLQSLPGVGKSLVMLSIADTITSNKLLWGNFEIQKGNVLIIDEENPGSIHRNRIEKMGISNDAPINFIHYQGVKIDDPRWLEALINVIEKGKYVLVIFDALIRMHGAKENDSDEMSKVMWGFREIVRRANTTVLIIHHERKSRDGERRERSRGSGDIVGAVDSQLILEEGSMTNDGKELILHPGKTRLKSFAPIRLVLNSDTLDITYAGNVLNSNKGIIQSVIQFLGDGVHGFEEIQQALGIPEKQLRTAIKNVLGKELILDSTPKQHTDYKGSPKKQFYKVNPASLFSNVAMFPPIGGETCHIEENRPGGNKVPGNMESFDSVGCGVVSEHGSPHETWTKKHVSEGAKITDVGNMENCIKTESVTHTEEVLEIEFVEEVKTNV